MRNFTTKNTTETTYKLHIILKAKKKSAACLEKNLALNINGLET